MRSVLSIFILVPWFLHAQLGGVDSFQSLNLTSNPRAAALGGSTVSIVDGDISQVFENASVLDSVTDGNIFFQFNPYFADVSVYSMMYSFNAGKIRGLSAGLVYANFGEFEMTDETGTILGTFSGNDYVFMLSKSHRLGPFVLGGSLKFASSTLAEYSASAMLVDVGGVFTINKNWTVGMVFENMGWRITEYSDFSSPALPFDVKVGTTFKPEYMPLRFTLTSTSLVDQNANVEDETTGRENNIADDVLKRVNIGAELLLSDHFQLIFGYNHKRKQELRLTEIGGGAGFSYGFMINIKRIQLRFSRATYHAAGGSSFISLQTNLNDFKKIL